jgi:alkylhydroperoxidase/carboxymuconolactone decarboxylase family protein YurZ
LPYLHFFQKGRTQPLVIVALTAKGGDPDQFGFHLKRGAESGLARGQLGEAISHLAFFAGRLKAISGTTAT